MDRNRMQNEQRRREFGVLLRGLRQDRGLTCEELATKTGNISRSAVATIERGKRQAGAKVGERLADALDLVDEQRRNFLMAALKTTSREVLPKEAAGLGPEFFMPIWKMLAGNLVRPGDIKRISNEGRLSKSSPAALKAAALKLAEKAEGFAMGIRRATTTDNNVFRFDLEVETHDGKIMLIELLTGRSK